MGIKSEEVRFTTQRSLNDLGRSLQIALAAAKAGSVEELQSGSGALAKFDDKADIEIIAEGASFTSMWAVQVYVWDHDDHREVAVVAMGDGGFARAMGGARNTTSLGSSIKKRDQIAADLR